MYKKINKKFKNILTNIFSLKNDENRKYKIITILSIKFRINRNSNIFKKLIIKYYYDYIKYLETGYQTNFIDFQKYEKYNGNIKPIAFYLPQYHTFPENDSWHGKGFTEWTNVTKILPQYVNHFQPQLPIDVGFYNLDTTKTMYRQIELAKNYGIYGFSFYYYWFQGKKIMHKPTYNYLNDKNLDFPFCLTWACENWTKLWDGGDKEILIESKLEENDYESFWNDIIPFFKDERYIKIDNKPVLLCYKPSVFEEHIFIGLIKYLQEQAKNEGFNGLYLIAPLVFGFTEDYFKKLGFDATCDFPPHNMKNLKLKKIKGYINPDFTGNIIDFKQWIKNKSYIQEQVTNNYKCCFTAWDNSARKAKTNANIFDGATPNEYKQWFDYCVKYTQNNQLLSDKFIFINAWNEWAEGTHLEPDSKNGYAYLQATRDILEKNIKG